MSSLHALRDGCVAAVGEERWMTVVSEIMEEEKGGIGVRDGGGHGGSRSGGSRKGHLHLRGYGGGHGGYRSS